tara:strand:+ start:149 stop:325 length:177 start_codon:yes stop_codon:yes gene_type:complete
MAYPQCMEKRMKVENVRRDTTTRIGCSTRSAIAPPKEGRWCHTISIKVMMKVDIVFRV